MPTLLILPRLSAAPMLHQGAAIRTCPASVDHGPGPGGAQLAKTQADSPSGSWIWPVSCLQAAGASVEGYLLFQ